MKTLKKIFILSIILSLVGIVNFSNLNFNNVYASTNGKSAEDAINWARSLENQWVGSGQCVAFISAYYNFLGQTSPSYYAAKDLINHVSDQPAGWTVIHDHNVQAQKGDILVYSGGTYGHVALYEADNAIWHANWGTDSGDNGTPVRWNGSYYKNLSDRYFEGVVRPDFNSDIEAPKFSEGELVLSSISANSYKVRVKVTDNVGVDYVNYAFKGSKDSSFGSWTKMTYSNGYYEATINTSKNDLITVHAYAFDKVGNQAGYAFPNWAMGSKKVDLGNFTARIVSKGNSNYCIGITGTTNGDDLQLVTKNSTDKTQLWKFTKLSNGNYKIINASTSNQGFDVDGGANADANSTPIQLWNHVDGAKQQEFMIVSYNGGYRIMPSNSKLGMGLDVANASYKAGTKIIEHAVNEYQNPAQTFTFEKAATALSLNRTSLNLNAGDSQTLTATVTPTDAATKNVTWKSSNTSVATVSSTGVVKAINGGTAVITATTKDGTNISKTCSVTVASKLNGLNQVNGTWYYYKNGSVDTSYTGLVQYNDSWFYVQRGQLYWGIETLVQYNGTWFYVNNSTVDWSYTGLCEYNGSWFYVQNGQINWGIETLVQYNGTWYYVNDSTLDWSYTGLCLYNGNWFYVQNGQVNWGIETLVQYNGTWYYVNDSTLDWTYTGLCLYNGNWFYVQNGQINWGIETLVQYNETWYYVNDSTLDWSFTGLCEYNGTSYYIQNGTLYWGYNGDIDYNGKTYRIQNSMAV